MRTKRNLLFGLVALSLALTAAPAIAERERDEGFRAGHSEERQVYEHRDRDRWAHDRREDRDRDSRLAYRAPYVAPSCYTQPGYWGWDGWQQMWVPPQTVCQ